MKNLFNPGIWLVVLCFTVTQCGPKEPPPIPVSPGISKIFLNGELTDFTPDIRRLPNSEVITYTFDQRRGKYLNELLVYPVELITGDFGKYMEFHQLHGDDQGNHKYERIETNDTFFLVEAVDTINKSAKGSFQAKFKRILSGKETADSHLPDTLFSQGEFDAKYREY